MHTVIIADRAPVIIQGIKFYLNQIPEARLVGSARHENELYKVMEKNKSDTLFLDPRLPGKNYTEQIKYLLVTYPDIKIIAFTTYLQETLTEQMFRTGIHGILSKFAQPLEIQHAIQVVHDNRVYRDRRIRNRRSLNASVPENHVDPFVREDAKFLKSVSLTNREKEVLTLVARGLKNREIAKQLFISKRTVESHRVNIMRKLELENSTQMIRFALAMGYF